MHTTPILWPKITVFERGICTVVDSLFIVFYLDPTPRLNARRINEALSKFMGEIAQNQLNFYVDEDGHTPPLPTDSEAFVHEQLSRQIDSGEIVELRLLDHEEGGNDCEVEFLHNPQAGSEKWPDKKSVLSFRLGAKRIQELGWPAVEAFALSLCDTLPYASGYVSPALSYGEFIEQAHTIALKYPGFDIARPSAVAWDIGDRAPGAYWLNFLGPRLAGALGGTEAIRGKLDALIEVGDCGGGGTFVKLGDVARVGDSNAAYELPLHEALARFIGSYLAIPYVKYIQDWNKKDTQGSWHRRFLR